MFPAIIILSLFVGSAVSLALTARFWFPLWRNEHSGTAHCLFLTNACLALAVLFEIFHTVTQLIEYRVLHFHFGLVSAMLIAAVSFFQFALMKGYFNTHQRKEK